MLREQSDDLLGVRNIIDVGLRGAEVRLYELITSKAERLRQSPEIFSGLQKAYRGLVDFQKSFAAEQETPTRAMIYLDGITCLISRNERLARKRKLSEYIEWLLKGLSPRLSVQLTFSELHKDSRRNMEKTCFISRCAYV